MLTERDYILHGVFMNQLSLADIHCDTPYEMFMTSQSFTDNSLSISAKKAEIYRKYLQVAAVWSDKVLDNDSAYKRSLEIIQYFKKDILFSESIGFFPDSSRINFILAIEDARILNNEISRLEHLYDEGVRILTPLWSGNTCIGGAYNTSEGLTDFGRLVIAKCLEFGIIPDVSHASLQSVDEIFELCLDKSPVIASHSDSYSINPHPRNLNDRQFSYIKKLGGLVGINLCSEHLGTFKNGTDTVIRHIEHYLELGGDNIICFGCDFDGATTPAELTDIASLSLLANKMARMNYSDVLIEKIFYLNAKNFMLKYIKNVINYPEGRKKQ